MEVLVVQYIGTLKFYLNSVYEFGMSLNVASMVKAGVQHYRHWHKKEDVSFSSRCQAAYETVKVTAQKVIQAFASWEAASIEMAVGRALVPIGGV